VKRKKRAIKPYLRYERRKIKGVKKRGEKKKKGN
jgi:hypothetical protein